MNEVIYMQSRIFGDNIWIIGLDNVSSLCFIKVKKEKNTQLQKRKEYTVACHQDIVLPVEDLNKFTCSLKWHYGNKNSILIFKR